jgi:hypothetical protein
MSSPQPFASAADLQTFMVGSDGVIDTDRANMMLRMASNAIREELQLEIDQVVNDVVVLDPPIAPNLTLFLLEQPITAVVLVEVRLQPTDTTWTALVPDVDYEWSLDGSVTLLPSTTILAAPFTGGLVGDEPLFGWPFFDQSIRVTYTHGFASLPQSLVDIAISAAARLYDNPLGTTSDALGGFNEKYSGNKDGGVQFTQLEQDTLDRYAEARLG